MFGSDCEQLSPHNVLKILAVMCECDSERSPNVSIIPAADLRSAADIFTLQLLSVCSLVKLRVTTPLDLHCKKIIRSSWTIHQQEQQMYWVDFKKWKRCVCLTFRCCRALLSSSSCCFFLSISVCHFLFSWGIMGDRVRQCTGFKLSKLKCFQILLLRGYFSFYSLNSSSILFTQTLHLL